MEQASWQLVAGEFSMRIDPADSVDQQFSAGCYASNLLGLLPAITQPRDVCIDVGAHKGYLTLHLAKAVGPDGLVIAFEPDPRAMEELASNVRHNRLANVILHPCALADRDGTCSFLLSNRLGWSTRFPNDLAKEAAGSTVSVETRRLDEVVRELGIKPETRRISFIKIDAEGSEPLILEGACNTLQQYSPILHFEVNKGALRAGDFSTDSIEKPLRALGYEFYLMRDNPASSASGRPLLHKIESLDSLTGDCEDVLAVNPCAGSGLSALVDEPR